MTCGPRTSSSPVPPSATLHAAVGIDQTGLGVRQRQANRPGAVARSRRIDVGHWAGLGQAIALDESGQRRCSRNPPRTCRVERRRAREHVTHKRKVGLLAPRMMLLSALQHGRHGRHQLRLAALRCMLQHGPRLEARVQVDGAALGPSRQQRHREAVAWKNGSTARMLSGAVRPADPVTQLHGVGHEVAVRQHDRLGRSRRAAGRGQHGDVLGRDRPPPAAPAVRPASSCSKR